MEKYRLWIAENVLDSFRTCAEMTLKMKEAFPELKRIRGHYYSSSLNRQLPHWWLIDPFGTVVDPTASQFTPFSPFDEYRPWNEGDPEPLGKCMYCGELCYTNSTSCSLECSSKLDDLYNKKDSHGRAR